MIRRTERVQCFAAFLWSIFARGSGAFFKRVVISFRSENPRKTSVPPCERWIIDEGLWSTEGHNSFNPLWVTAASANTLLLGGPWCMYWLQMKWRKQRRESWDGKSDGSDGLRDLLVWFLVHSCRGYSVSAKRQEAFLIEDLAPVVKPQSISTLIGGKVQFVQGTNGHQVITLVRGLWKPYSMNK